MVQTDLMKEVYHLAGKESDCSRRLLNDVVVERSRRRLIVVGDGNFGGKETAVAGDTTCEGINVQRIAGVRRCADGSIGIYVAAFRPARKLVINVLTARRTNI